MKPIEPGCLCMIFGLVRDAKDNGKSVVAIKHYQTGEITPTGRTYSGEVSGGWLVEGDVFNVRGEHGFAFLSERNLIRIDGHEEKQTQHMAETSV